MNVKSSLDLENDLTYFTVEQLLVKKIFEDQKLLLSMSFLTMKRTILSIYLIFLR